MAYYNKIQLVAYHTPTFLGSDVHKPPPVGPVHPAIQKLTNDDEKFRAMRMYLVATWAATHKYVDHNAKTLKVFLAPEFYFKSTAESSTKMGKGVKRSAGKFGAYSFNVMLNLLECLRTIFTTPVGKPTLFNNWLLVPGSIVSDLPAGKTYGGGAYYLNTAPVIKGEKDGFFHYIQKHLVSGIDGPPISNGVYSGPNSPYKDTIQKLKKKGLDDHGARIFTCDNIKFAFEVCLDHAQSVIKKTLQGTTDVHMVISCGMMLNEKSLLGKAGGLAMICDGINNNTFPRSDVRKIISRSGKAGKMGPSIWDCKPDVGTNPPQRSALPALVGKIKGRATIPPDLQVKPFKSATLYKNGKPTPISSQNIHYFMFPEEIVWYEPVVL